MAFQTIPNDKKTLDEAAAQVAAKSTKVREWKLMQLDRYGHVKKQLEGFKGTEAQASDLLGRIGTTEEEG